MRLNCDLYEMRVFLWARDNVIFIREKIWRGFQYRNTKKENGKKLPWGNIDACVKGGKVDTDRQSEAL